MRKTITFKSLICTIPLLLLFAVVSFGQSFHKTYTTTAASNTPYKVRQTNSGYLLELKGINKYEIITTDANGNFQSRRTDDFTNANGFQVTYRMRNGEYLLYKIEDNVGQLKFQVRDQNNNIKRAFTLFYPAGQKGAIGAIEQYEDDKVFIAYSYGTGDYGNPQPRTISYVKRNIYNDRNDMTGSFQTIGGVVNSPTGAELLPDGTIYMTILQDIGSFYQSYIAKINSAGNLVWRNQASSLERFIRNFTADTDGDIWYTYSQSFSNVVKLENSTGDATSFFPDQFGFSGTDVDAIIPTSTGGTVLVAGTSNGQMRTLKLNNGQVRLSNNTITAAQTNGNNKTPRTGIRNSNGEVIVFGLEPGRVFLTKLGADGQWVSGGNPGGGNGVDLDLSANSNTPSPGVWQQMSMTITARNTGSSTASNVKVKVEIPTKDVVLNGGNPFTATKGNFQWWGNNEWTIGTIAAGRSETLTLNFWNKNTNSKKVCAQIIAASGSDPDSTPNNGGNCRTSEDDEVSYSFNGGGQVIPQKSDLWISDFQISNNILKQGDVRNFTFDLNNTGDAAVQGDYVINAYMSTSQSSPGTRVVGDINTGNTGLGTTQNVPGAIRVPSNLTPGTYYVHLVADANNQIAEKNENNNRRVSRPIVVQANGGGNPPPPPPGGSGAIYVSMTTNNTSPRQWGFFSVQLIARNTGSSTANNVKVKFTKPAEVTYKGGDTHNTSKGNFQWWGNNEWNIGSLGANQSATITINYFRLSPNGFALTGSVTSGGGNDAATINFGNAANGINNRSAIVNNMTEEPFAIVNAYPNPSTDYIDIAIYVNEAQTSELEIFSLTGKRIFGNQYDLIEGLNEIRIETIDFPTGSYFIKMDPFHKYLRQLNFVVVRP